MTWTYTPSATPSAKDLVRFYVGDTRATDPQLQDEEIQAVLADEGSNVMRAVVTCANSLASFYGRMASEGNRKADALHKHYLALADRWRMKMARTGLVPFAGGLSIAGKNGVVQNDDRVQPFFGRDQMTEPGTEPSSTTANPPWPPVYW